MSEEEVDGDKNGFFHIIFNRMNASNKNIMKMKDRYIGELELLRSSKTPASILCVCVCVLKSSPCHRNTNWTLFIPELTFSWMLISLTCCLHLPWLGNVIWVIYYKVKITFLLQLLLEHLLESYRCCTFSLSWRGKMNVYYVLR